MLPPRNPSLPFGKSVAQQGNYNQTKQGTEYRLSGLYTISWAVETKGVSCMNEITGIFLLSLNNGNYWNNSIHARCTLCLNSPRDNVASCCHRDEAST